MTTLLAVVGPTASGKSDLCLRLCERLDGELVSADSVQIYRHFDIGSSKPDARERERVPHHLIDELDPLDTADAARFMKLAERRIEEIEGRGKRPIVCGGTFLWVRALIYGLAEAPPADESIRERHRREAERHGRRHLHERLRDVDPASHARLGENDLVRVSRALEVYELTGRRLSELQAEHGFQTPRRAARLIGVEHERPRLRERITSRAREMLERGWIAEVEHLLQRGYARARAMRSVGYRQIAEALGAGAPIDVPSLGERIAQTTNAFARHQLTWLRSQPVEWLRPEELDGWIDAVARDASSGLPVPDASRRSPALQPPSSSEASSSSTNGSERGSGR